MKFRNISVICLALMSMPAFAYHTQYLGQDGQQLPAVVCGGTGYGGNLKESLQDLGKELAKLKADLGVSDKEITISNHTHAANTSQANCVLVHGITEHAKGAIVKGKESQE